MSTVPLRAAVLGCGAIGCKFADSHAAAYEALPETRLVAVSDIVPERARRCAASFFATNAYGDPRELLAIERPDLVSVCTPNETHLELTAAALKSAGIRGVLAEKPLAMVSGDAWQLVELASTRRVALAVNYLRRYAPGITMLRELLSSGELGVLRTVTGYYTKGLVHNGTHSLDLIRHLAGEIEVTGARCQDPRDDTCVDVDLITEVGARGSLLGLDTNDFTVFELDLMFSAGRARLLEGGERIEIWRPRARPAYRGMVGVAFDEHFSGGLDQAVRAAAADIARCALTGDEPWCSGADGFAALALAERALELAGVSAPDASSAP